jgi:hypothetical protein
MEKDIKKQGQILKIGKKKIPIHFNVGEIVEHIPKSLNPAYEDNCFGVVVDVQYFFLDSTIRYIVSMADSIVTCTENELLPANFSSDENKPGFQKHMPDENK